MSKRPNYWYDTTIQVRVYLPGYPPEEGLAVDGTDDMSLDLTGLLDGVTTPGGLLLSVHDLDWGEAHGFEEEVPDVPDDGEGEGTG